MNLPFTSLIPGAAANARPAHLPGASLSASSSAGAGSGTGDFQASLFDFLLGLGSTLNQLEARVIETPIRGASLDGAASPLLDGRKLDRPALGIGSDQGPDQRPDERSIDKQGFVPGSDVSETEDGQAPSREHRIFPTAPIVVNQPLPAPVDLAVRTLSVDPHDLPAPIEFKFTSVSGSDSHEVVLPLAHQAAEDSASASRSELETRLLAVLQGAEGSFQGATTRPATDGTAFISDALKVEIEDLLVRQPAVASVVSAVPNPVTLQVAPPVPNPVTLQVAPPVANPEVIPVVTPAPAPVTLQVAPPVPTPEVIPVVAPAPEVVTLQVAPPVPNPEVIPVVAPAPAPVTLQVAPPVSNPEVIPVVAPAPAPVTLQVAPPVANPEVIPVAAPAPEAVTLQVAPPVTEPAVTVVDVPKLSPSTVQAEPTLIEDLPVQKSEPVLNAPQNPTPVIAPAAAVVDVQNLTPPPAAAPAAEMATMREQFGRAVRQLAERKSGAASKSVRVADQSAGKATGLATATAQAPVNADAPIGKPEPQVFQIHELVKELKAVIDQGELGREVRVEASRTGQSRAAIRSSVTPFTSALGDADESVKPVISADARTVLWTSSAAAAAKAGEVRAPVDVSMPTQIREAADFLLARVDGTVTVNGDGEIKAELRLFPPDLGRIRVELTMTEGRTMKARFIAELSGTGDVLRQNLHHFSEALTRQGVNVDRIVVEVEPRALSQSGTSDSARHESRGKDGSAREQARGETSEHWASGQDSNHGASENFEAWERMNS